MTSSGKIQIESKDEIRKRLGRSTDSGDAVVQACFDAARGAGAGWMEYFRQQTAEDKERPPGPPAILPLADFLAGRGVPISKVDLCARGHRYFGPEARCGVCGRCAKHTFVDGVCAVCGAQGEVA